jgi:hypothetical protein
VVGVLLIAAPARAQQSPTVTRAVDYLRSRGKTLGSGEASLAALAMIKAEVPPTDPGLKACLDTVDSRFEGSVYRPAQSGGPEIYEAGIMIMAFANLDPNGRRSQIKSLADYLISKQKPSGGWDYQHRSYGDTSISQYAVLGLWEAENAGVTVHPRVWDNAAQFFLTSQSPQGSWTYHRDENTNLETLSMTAAGLGSLLICQKQLQAHRRAVSAQNPLLIPLLNETQRVRYSVQTPQARMNQGIIAGIAWIAKNFTTTNDAVVGQSPFYCLYGIERVGALADKSALGGVDWFDQGSRFIVSKQSPDGSFNSRHGDAPNTSWAILFLTKSTAKSIERIRVRRLGAGELYGGKGLPKDLSTISEAGGRLVARPMDGAIEGMLSVLEDPRAENADSALAGLIERYRKDGPKAIQPYRGRFLKLLTDRDPGVRRVAVWALARMGDLAICPALIPLLRDTDESVVSEARQGLQLLSRKIDGFGPPSPSTPEQRVAAAKAWLGWYESVRPLGVDDADGLGGKGVSRSKTASGGTSLP